jgi:ATP synthase protein I
MMATYGRIVRRSAALTSAVAVVAVVLCAALIGAKGAYGALIGVGVVTVFFGISILVVGRAAKISPQVMMVTALTTYVVKFIAFMIVLIAIGKSTAFSGRSLGFTAVACILAWMVAQIVTAMRLRLLYVDPDGSSRA